MSAKKVMANLFWDSEGIVLIDYLIQHGSTITGINYVCLIRKCQAALKKKRQGKLYRSVLFHQENVPAHTSSQAPSAIQNASFEARPSPQLWPLFVNNSINWRNSWKGGSLLQVHCKWLTEGPQSRIQVFHGLEKCRASALLLEGLCWKVITYVYSVVNCVKLWTFELCSYILVT